MIYGLPDGKILRYGGDMYYSHNNHVDWITSGDNYNKLLADVNSVCVVGQYSSSTWQQEITIQLGFTPKAAFIGTKYNTQDWMDSDNHIRGFVSAQNVKSNSSTYIMIVNDGILLHDYGGNYTLFNNGWTAHYICFK